MIFPLHELAFTCLLIFISVAKARRCSNPAVRREWNSISETERSDWIDAVKCLAKLPHDDSLSPSVDPSLSLIPAVNSSSSYYDDFVYLHMDLNIEIHFTGLFLPWHRGFLHAFESALKKRCGYNGTQPYWNWSLNTEDFFNSSIFDPSPTSGFGRNGDPNDDYQITDGAFATDFLVAYPVPHRVRRNFTLQPWQSFNPFADGLPDPAVDPNTFGNTTFDKQDVNKLVNGFVGDFNGFLTYLDSLQGVHAGVHLTVGADLFGSCPSNAGSSCIGGPKWASNDPLFFMHHSMIDKIWYDWQHKDEANFWEFGGGSIQALQNYTIYGQYPNGYGPSLDLNSSIPSDGIYEVHTIFDVMDTTGEILCYVYE